MRPDTRQLTDRITLSDREVRGERAPSRLCAAVGCGIKAVADAQIRVICRSLLRGELGRGPGRKAWRILLPKWILIVIGAVPVGAAARAPWPGGTGEPPAPPMCKGGSYVHAEVPPPPPAGDAPARPRDGHATRGQWPPASDALCPESRVVRWELDHVGGRREWMRRTVAGLSLVVAAASGMGAALPAPATAAGRTVAPPWHGRTMRASRLVVASGREERFLHDHGHHHPAGRDGHVIICVGFAPCGNSETDPFRGAATSPSP
jgi:hypothetical protein